MPPDPAPAPELDPNALSAAEEAFFKSRGAETEGLVPPAPGAPPGPAPGATGAVAPPAGATGAAPPAPGEELDEAAEEAAIAAGKPPKRVNYNKWKRTADELAAARAEADKLREQSTRVDERMRLINEALATTPAQAAAAEEEDPAPDPEQDIFGYVRWQGRQMERLNAELGTMRQASQAERQMQDLNNWYRSEANTFAQAEPAFALAYVHLIQNRLRELEAGGITNKAEADRIVVEEERAVVEKARKDGVSPAKRIYDLAIGRGFDKQKAIEAATAARNAANGGAQPQPAPAGATGAAPAPGTPLGGGAAPAAAPSVAAEIEAIKKGQGAALSLSGGGGVPADALTPQALADMSEEEFAQVYARLSKGRQRELMGT